MKQHYPEVPIGKLCELFGKTRHAWYDNNWRQQDQLLKEEIIVQLVLDIRKILPSIGTRKLLHMLHPKLQEHNFQVGRDYLFDVLTQHKLLIRKRKRKIITTNSKHWMRKYSNLIEPLQLTRAEQLWVSDITYIPGRGELSTLVSTRLITHYGEIVSDLQRTMLAYDLLKIVNKVTETPAGEEEE